MTETEQREALRQAIMALERDPLRASYEDQYAVWLETLHRMHDNLDAVTDADTLNPRLAGWSYNPNVYPPVSSRGESI